MRMLSTARAIAAILQSTLTMEIGLRVCAADRIGPRMHVPSCVYWLFIASPFQASACEGGRILYGANTRVRRCMACASSQREGGRIGQGGRARQIHYLNLLQLQLWIRDLCVSSPGAPGSNLSNLCTRIELVSVSEVCAGLGVGEVRPAKCTCATHR